MISVYLPARASGSTQVQWRESGGAWQTGGLESVPASAPVRVVLDVGDCWLGALRLPPLRGARLRKALPGAVEDALAVEVASQHLAVSEGDAGTERLVAAVDRAWLAQWLARFEQAGLRLADVVPWPATLPEPAPGTWVLRLQDDGVAMRVSSDLVLGCKVDSPASAARWAELCLTQYPRPERLGVQAASPALMAAFESAWRAEVMPLAVLPLDDCDEPRLSLLQHEFAGRARRTRRWLALWDRRVRREALALAASLVLIWMIGLNVDWYRQAQLATALRQGMMADFRDTFPKVQAILDPVKQMRQEVERLQAAAGQVTRQDALPMMARVVTWWEATPVLQGLLQAGPNASALEQLQWSQGGELRLRLKTMLSPEQRRALEEGAVVQGLRVKLAEDGLSVQIQEGR